MGNKKSNTIYDKGFTELSIERVTEIDSSVSKQNITNESDTIFFKKQEDIKTRKVDELLAKMQKDTYNLLMNSDPLLYYQTTSSEAFNIYETKLHLLKQYKNVDEKIQNLKKHYYETVNVKKT